MRNMGKLRKLSETECCKCSSHTCREKWWVQPAKHVRQMWSKNLILTRVTTPVTGLSTPRKEYYVWSLLKFGLYVGGLFWRRYHIYIYLFIYRRLHITNRSSGSSSGWYINSAWKRYTYIAYKQFTKQKRLMAQSKGGLHVFWFYDIPDRSTMASQQ